jgi:hypothetical protein
VQREKNAGEKRARQPGRTGHAGMSGSPSFKLPKR